MRRESGSECPGAIYSNEGIRELFPIRVIREIRGFNSGFNSGGRDYYGSSSGMGRAGGYCCFLILS